MHLTPTETSCRSTVAQLDVPVLHLHMASPRTPPPHLSCSGDCPPLVQDGEDQGGLREEQQEGAEVCEAWLTGRD